MRAAALPACMLRIGWGEIIRPGMAWGVGVMNIFEAHAELGVLLDNGRCYGLMKSYCSDASRLV